MKRLDINGVVINDDDKWFYDWTEQSAVSPKDVKDFLAKTDGKEAIQVAINSQGGSVLLVVRFIRCLNLIREMLKSWLQGLQQVSLALS